MPQNESLCNHTRKREAVVDRDTIRSILMGALFALLVFGVGIAVTHRAEVQQFFFFEQAPGAAG